MRTINVFLVAVMLAVPMFGQNAVEEAKAKRVKQHHEAQVDRAKELLERKESLERELANVDAKLAKLANGEDVPDDVPTSGVLTWTNGSSIGLSGHCVDGLGNLTVCH